MKRIIFLFFGWCCCQQLAGQSSQYAFPEIGFSFFPPQGYVLVDSSIRDFSPDGKQQVWVKKYQFKKETSNLFFTLIKNTGWQEQWDTVYRKEMKHMIESVRRSKPANVYESDTSDFQLDSRLFHKLGIRGFENGQLNYLHAGLYRFHNGYRLHISWTCRQEEAMGEIEKAVKGGRFID
jgi:hypothetical protein